MRSWFVLGSLFLVLFASPVKAEDNYVFLLKARGNPYWTAMADGIKDTAKAKGIKATVYFTETDRASEEDLNTCMTSILTKPKVIVMAATTPNIAVQCFKKATKAGIIVADVDANITIEDAKKEGVDMAFTVGSDNFKIGQEAAKYVAKLGTPSPKIFILEGAVGSAPGKKRVDGFRTKVLELLPSAKIEASVTSDWDRLKAMDLTTNILQRAPDIDIIYAANDTTALGAAEAVRNAGKSDKIKVIGVDGTVDARKAIMNGRLTASVAQLPYLMGKRSVELAIESAQGKISGKTETTATPVLTKEMLDANKDPILHYVR